MSPPARGRGPRARLGRGPRVRTLVAGLSAFVLVVPIFAVWLARLGEGRLVRETERQLLAEAVVVGEVYRAALDPDAERTLGPYAGPAALRYRPTIAELTFARESIGPPAERGPGVDEHAEPGAAGAPGPTASATVARRLSALLERALIRNLTGVRVLDARGVVVASSEPTVGYSLAHLPEVAAARAGGYAPRLRERRARGPRPGFDSLSRAAAVRVSLAIAVFDPPRPGSPGERVLGVVYASRTPADLDKYLWDIRDELLLPFMLTLALTAIVVAAMTRLLVRPLAALEAYARGARAASRDTDARPPLALPALAAHEIADLAETVEGMRGELAARARDAEVFAVGAVHELKTPLTAIRGAAEVLLDDDGALDDAARRRFLSGIVDDAVRADRAVNRALELARLEARAPARVRVPLRQLVEGAAARARRRGAEVRVDAPDREVAIDPAALEAALDALLDNAARHGAGAPIEVGARVDGGALVIRVRDHGPALAPDHFAHAFERFQTTERGRGGTGIGLALVRAAAEAHGGAATARAAPDGGAEVVVSFERVGVE